MKNVSTSNSQNSPNLRHNGQIRTILIEDNNELRETLMATIKKSPAMMFLEDFANAEDALAKAAKLEPDVAVIDIVLPGIDGISCIAKLKQAVPHCLVLVLTAFDDSEKIFRALKAGASGYLIKSANPNELVQGILDVWAGGAPMTATVARKVVESFKTSQNPTCEILTPREEEILGLLAKGYLTKEISDTVGVSDATVRFHLRNIYAKLHVNNRTQAILKYLG